MATKMNAVEVFFKYAMCIINGIAMLNGLITIILGTWLMLSSPLGGMHNFFFYLGLFVVVLGIYSTVQYLLGCWGLSNENSCMLFTFAGLLTIVFLAGMTLVMTAGIFSSEIPALVNSTAYTTFMEAYDPDKADDDSNNFNTAWKEIQSQMHCCGVNGYEDYAWLSRELDNNVPIPNECCKRYSCDTADPDNLNTVGCATPIATNLEYVATVYFQWGLVGGALQLAWIAGTIYFALKFRRARRSQSYETLINPPPYTSVSK